MKTERTKRVLAAALATLLLTGTLAGCGKNNEGTQGNSGDGLSEYVYVSNYVTIDKNVKEMNNLSCVGDTIYFTQNLPVHSDGTSVTDAEIDEMNEYYENLYKDDRSYISSTAAVAVEELSEVTAEVEDAIEEPREFDINYVTGLFSMKTDGTDYTNLSDYAAPEKPEGDFSSSNINRICADKDGNLWVAENTSQTIFDLPEGFNEATDDRWEHYVKDETKNYIRKLSPTGAELGVLDLTDHIVLPEGEDAQYYSFYVSDMTVDTLGNVYISDGNNSVFVSDSDCQFLFRLEFDGWVDSFIKGRDGFVGIAAYDQAAGSRVLKRIDVATKDWGEDKKIPNDVWRTSSGGNTYDFCYSDNSNLYGYDLKTEAGTKILNWINCDINSDNIEFSTVSDDGNVFAISREWNREGGNPSYEIVNLVKTPRSEVKEKAILTMATMWLDYNVRERVLKFNKTNPDYRIEILDYSEFNTDDDDNAGITKLNTEIISGKVPDLLDVSQLPYQQYAAKGLLEDLYSFLDSDADYSREDMVQSIMKATETDGKLYQLASGFTVISIIASPSVVGNKMGWTMDEMQDIISQHPGADKPFGLHIDRNSVLQYFCMMNMDDYMNWQTGKCDFNSDGFKGLLEFAKSFPSSEDNQAAMQDNEWVEPAVLIREGRQLFDLFSANDFQNFQYYKATFGGSVTFKGLPSSNRDGNVASFNGGLAMTTSCKNKEGAWQFMRTMLDEDYQKDQWNFPIVQKVFDEKLAEAMKQEYTTDEFGNKIPLSRGGMSYGDGEVVEFYAITQEEADQLMDMINSVTKCVSYDEGIINIIAEEAEAFFKGEKDVSQTAEIIQSRMNIYINEQR